MWSPDQTIRNRFLPTKKTEAGRKRKWPLTLAVYDPAAAEERSASASLLALSARAGALVPFLARPPVDAVPLSFAAPRAEPPWLRQRVGLRLDLAVHFIGDKALTFTDLEGQQNRFRLPTEAAMRVLRSILFDQELDAAKIPRAGMEVATTAPKKPQPPPPPLAEEELLQGKGKIEKRTRKKGAKHGGLPVDLWNVDAGVMKLRLTRWESARAIVIKGEGYLDFITRCGFKENDVVQIWAFKERQFRYFGQWFLHDRPLCVVLAKKEQQPAPLLAMAKCTIL